MSKIALSLAGLPEFNSTSIFCSLDTETGNRLEAFPNVLERTKAAIRFCQYIGGGIPVADDDRELMQSACLRASLMEFVGMEEVLPLDLEMRADSRKPLEIKECRNTLLILLKEMRHLHLHLINTRLSKDEVNAVNYSMHPEPYYTVFTVESVPYEDLLRLKSLRNASRYDPVELDNAISWLDQAQRKWGIGDVVQSGIGIFAKLILSTYEY